MGYLKWFLLLAAAPFVIRIAVYYIGYVLWAMQIGPMPIKLVSFGKPKQPNQPQKRKGFGFLNEEELNVLSAERKESERNTALQDKK